VAEERLARLLVENAEKEARRQTVLGRLRSFLQIQRSRIPNGFRDIMSRWQQLDTLTPEEANPEILYSQSSMVLSEAVHLLIELCSSSLGERREAINDKMSGMHVLLTDIYAGDRVDGVKEIGMNPDVLREYEGGLCRSRALLVELVRLDHPLTTEWTRVRAELERATRAANELAERLARLEKQRQNDVASALKKIDDMERLLTDRTKHGRHLGRESRRLGERILAAKGDVNRHRGRSKALEHVRNIGYVDEVVKPTLVHGRRARNLDDVRLPLIGGRRRSILSSSHEP